MQNDKSYVYLFMHWQLKCGRRTEAYLIERLMTQDSQERLLRTRVRQLLLYASIFLSEFALASSSKAPKIFEGSIL